MNWTETLPNPNTDRSLDYMWCHLHENSDWGLNSQNDRRRVLVNVRKEKKSDRDVGVLKQGTPTWRPHTKPVLGGTFFRITRPQDIAQPWDFDMLFTYSSYTTFHFLDLIYWMVGYFIFHLRDTRTKNCTEQKRVAAVRKEVKSSSVKDLMKHNIHVQSQYCNLSIF